MAFGLQTFFADVQLLLSKILSLAIIIIIIIMYFAEGRGVSAQYVSVANL